MNAAKKQMRAPLRVLHLEDSSWDAELVRVELERSKVPCSIRQVWTKKDFDAALKQGGLDLILSDSQLPSFQTMNALTRTREVCPEVPFVFVSGSASPALKTNAFFRGAVDVIQKSELSKLVSLVNRLFATGKAGGELPEMGMPVFAHCAGFTCLAYVDREGKWRDYARSGELPDVIDWCDL